jgi:hypothetical protein
MKIREALRLINRMKADGVIERYAIGGAVGATFYLEPVATLDIDIFFAMPNTGVLVNPTPIFDYLLARGCRAEGEYIVIGSWPVQFLPASGPLLEEALAEAREVDIEGVKSWVFSAEHLAAIALQTGRAKDRSRVLQFIEAKTLDPRRLRAIIARHGLEARWRHFEDLLGGGP